MGRATTTGAAQRPPVHPVDEVLPLGRTLTLGLQHILSMYAGVVAPPLIVGAAAGLRGPDLAYLVSAALVMAGVATLVQTLGVWRFGIRMPFVNGPTFAAVTPMVLIAHGGGGLPAVFGAALVSSLLGLAVAGRFSRLVRFFPPLVTGTVITLIGLSILKVGVQWSAGGVGAPDFGSPRNLAVALGVLAFIVLLQRFARGFAGRVAVLLGLLLGTAVAAPLGMTDLSGVARVDLVGITTPFHFGVPRFELAAIVSMLVVQLVILAECTADALAVGEVVGRPVGPAELAMALRADTAASALSSVLNAFPCSAFAQNIGLVQLTGVRSRFVVAAGGGVLVLLGLLPPLGALVAAVPAPVLGGAGIALFGTVAASGVRTLGRSGFRGPHDLVVVGVSLGLGMIPLAVPTFWEHLPAAARTVLDSGISVGTVAAIALNLLFNGRPGAGSASAPPLPVPRPPSEGSAAGAVDRRTVLTGCAVATLDDADAEYERGHVVVEGGRIVAVGPGEIEPRPGDHRVDARGCLATPGFVHLSRDLRTSVAPGLSPDRLATLDDEFRIAVARATAARLTLTGHTCCSRPDDDGVFAAAAPEIGIRLCETHSAIEARPTSPVTGDTARARLRAATRDAARQIRNGDQLGSLEPGKLADIAVWRLDDLAHVEFDDPVTALVAAPPARVWLSLVGGRVVVRDGRLVTADEQEVADAAARAARALRQHTGISDSVT